MESPISLERVLGVVREFDELGGASLGLVAWELCVAEDRVRAAWETAMADQLLEPVGQDVREGEELWVLTRTGWASIGVSPVADRRRRDAIDRLGILTRTRDPALSALARLASYVAGGGPAAVHVFDARFQHRTASHLAPLGRHAAHDALCQVAVDSERPVVVSDAVADPRFAHSSFVAGDEPIRFYAALPLRTIDEGIVVGTLCTFDHEPRDLTETQVGLLGDLAHQVVSQLELSRVAGDLGYLATHDPLTGAVNRLLLADRLEQATARAARANTEALVIVLDLDGFKVINDELGHAAGDEVLIAVSTRLRGHVRDTDTVARLGGDEFALIVELTDEGSTERVLDRLREALAAPILVGEARVTVRVSMGAAVASADDTVGGALARADHAMYADKV